MVRAHSLASHIFFRVVAPIGTLFALSLVLLNLLLEQRLRAHLEEELLTRDAQMTALPVWREAGALPDADLVTTYSADGTPAGTTRRIDGKWTPVPAHAPLAEKRRLVEVAGHWYFVTTQAVERQGKAAGWTVTGREWRRDLPNGGDRYVLTRNGRPVQDAALALPACAPRTVCEARIDGRPHLVVRSAAVEDPEFALYQIQSIDAVAGPLIGGVRELMAVVAVLTLTLALGLALWTGRSVARPLRRLAETKGREAPSGRIREIEQLGETLRAAARAAEQDQENLRQAYIQFMGAIVTMLDARDRYTAGHSHRVSDYAEALARDAGLPAEEVNDIRIGALLHDIGKIGVPDEVLRKHEKLTPAEFEVMKQHTTIGRQVLEQVRHFDRYLDIVELHHESMDGRGYPRGLKGEQIPLAARIVKIADVYDALRTDRPYRKGMPPQKVHQILFDGAGTELDRMLVAIFLTRTVPRITPVGGLTDLFYAVREASAGSD
jgi:putative nucleotidyltransferase with HDIG domain